MTNLFTTINDLVPKLTGWCSPLKAQALASVVIALRPNVVVEIGIFGGRSFLPMALALKEIGRGVAIGVDPWCAPASASGQVNPADKDFWSRCDHEQVRRDFIVNLNMLGLDKVTKIEHMESNEFDSPPSIDFLHLDGNHGEQAYKDAIKFTPAVRVGGMVFLDDLDWSGGAVRKGESHILANGFTQLYTMDTGAMYQRIK